MKSIIYIIIAVLLSSTLLSTIPNQNNPSTEVIQIQCNNSRFNDLDFAKSEMIIKNRLEDFGINIINIESNNANGSIKLTISGNFESEVIDQLVSSKGSLEFYGSNDRELAVKELDADDFLYKLMNIPRKKKAVSQLSSNAIFGLSRGDNRTEIEEYLKFKATDGLKFPGIKFAWSSLPDENSNYELYVLNETSALSNKDVAEATVSANNQGNSEIMISFTSEGSSVFKELTKQNIGKPLAILIDDQIYSAPVVNAEIEKGKCIISGNFSEKDSKILVSLLRNKALPLDFKVIR